QGPALEPRRQCAGDPRCHPHLRRRPLLLRQQFSSRQSGRRLRCDLRGLQGGGGGPAGGGSAQALPRHRGSALPYSHLRQPRDQGMSTGIETHRSMVKAWECDSFGHFTVAYYFDRIADASVTAREMLAVPQAWTPTEYLARFASELRAGEV